MKKKRLFAKIIVFILIAAMLLGSGFYLVYLFADSGSVAYGADADAYSKLDNLKSVIEEITKNYKDDIEAAKLVDAAYEGVFDALDNWTVYYSSKEEEEEFTNSLLNSEYSGVGLTLSEPEEDVFSIVSVNINGPAFYAGVKKNDVITHINGQSVSGWTLEKVANSLRGEAGSTVVVKMLRGKEALEFSLVRAKLSTSTVSCEMLEGNIALITISGFNLGTKDDFFVAHQNMLLQGAEKIIIDLRDNGGGYMDEALNCASMLLPVESEILYYLRGDEVIDKYYVIGDASFYQKRDTVVIVNENTASAAELFAAALQDNGVAKLVGVNTYGKGVAQQIFEGKSGDYYKLSTLYFTGPKKKIIDGCGVKPDFIVYNNAGLTSEEAAKLNASIVPMNEGKKYLKQGSYGLNVLAAQQRLNILGYSVDASGILDGATMDALKQIQKDGGGFPYGGLDFGTIKMLEERYQAFIYGSEDAQLEKAISLLTN